ncbi:MAG TPA: Flp family type IVb pilin [Acidobacteriaceae bacterium]|jgi:pilus assembly protein Flp/PilA
MRKLWNLFRGFQKLMLREEGQDLIEYAMVVALIAFATTAGMQTAAAGVNTVFTTIGGILTSATG